jgi:hypothetical protein
MMWEDARAIPRVQLNCGLIKIMIEESLGKNDPEDSYVEKITQQMGEFIAIQLNKGKRVSVSDAFIACT